MANIPPHYTDRFILQRYNKALHFVQNLPVSSSFQPTKSQKLELYSLYKQVSQGDINTQRPGLFDVVGRAKWDAWKKLEGISTLEARHIYVEALLRAAAEAYKKNIGREEAQQIIHTFAIMKPSGGNDSDDLVDVTEEDDASNQEEEEEDTSVASEDAEEQAYLRDIQQSNSNNKVTLFQLPDNNNTTPYGSPDRSSLLSRNKQPQQKRPSSVASIQTMVTAPMTPRRSTSTNTNTSSLSRPPSVATSVRTNNNRSRLGQNNRGNEKRPQQHHMTRDDLRVLPNKTTFNEEEFDDSVNPWQHIPTSSNSNSHHHHQQQRRHQHDRSSEGSIENNSNNNNRPPRQQFLQKTASSSHIRLPSPMYNNNNTHQQQPPKRTSSLSSPPPPPQLHSMTPIHHNFYQQSPAPDSSASSSVTATPQLANMLLHNSGGNESVTSHSNRMVYTPVTADSRSNSRNQLRYNDQAYTSVVALGPATKRALESLQNEVIALNDRIDDLCGELAEKNRQRAAAATTNKKENDDDGMGDGWKWVIKAAIKYAGVNLMTAFILFFILYKSKSPIAYVILKQTSKFWQSFKLRVLISNVVI